MSLRLDPREHASIALRLLVSLLSGAIALLLVAIPVMAAGANPFEAYVLMAQGAFGSMFALSETLNRATPLILTGLAGRRSLPRQALEHRRRGPALHGRPCRRAGRVRISPHCQRPLPSLPSCWPDSLQVD